MKLGFVTALFPALSFEEVLKFAAEEAYDCVEVMCWPQGKAERKFAGVSHVDVEGFDRARADHVLGLCAKYNVGLSALGYYPNPLSKNAEEAETGRSHLKKVIDAAPLLGLSTVNTFIGADWSQPMNVNFDRFREVWPDIIKYAEDRGVRVGIENCPMLFSKDEWPFGKNLARSPDVWRRMFEHIPSPSFGLNIDPSHLVLQLMDPIAPIKEFGSRIFHAHAKDMKIEREELNDRGVLTFDWGTPKIPGLGDVDWGKWISALTDAGYDGPVCVEVEDEAFMRDLDSRKQSLRISRNVLRPLVGPSA
jgi:sugar phosphate isomerase/epimerase